MPTRSAPGDARLVADHRRHRPGQRGRQVRIVVGHRVDDEPVDGRAGDPEHVLGVRPGRHQQQADPGLVALQGQALEEGDRARVAEGVGHLLGQQQPDGTGLAGAQRAGHRVRARDSPSAGRPPSPWTAAAGTAGRAGCRRWRRWSGRCPARRPATPGSPAACVRGVDPPLTRYRFRSGRGHRAGCGRDHGGTDRPPRPHRRESLGKRFPETLPVRGGPRIVSGDSHTDPGLRQRLGQTPERT